MEEACVCPQTSDAFPKDTLGFAQSLEDWLGGQCVTYNVGSAENLHRRPLRKLFSVSTLGLPIRRRDLLPENWTTSRG